MFEFSPYHFDDRLFFIGAALIANVLIGGPAWLHQQLGLHVLGQFRHRLLSRLEQKLNRSKRSAQERMVRGIIVLVLMVGLAGFVAASLSALSATHPMGFLAEILILALFIPQRRLYEEGWKLFSLLNTNKEKEAREWVARFSLRSHEKPDKHTLMRDAMEHMASGFADRVLSPVFWYILMGLPGFVASKIITEAGLMLGYESRRHQAYGRAAGAFEMILNRIPSLISGWIICLAAYFVPKAHPKRAWQTMSEQHDGIHPPGKGAPIAATAGALDCSLGGPHSVQGHLVKDAWVGKGSAKVGLPRFRKFLLLFSIACLLNVALIATLLYLLA